MLALLLLLAVTTADVVVVSLPMQGGVVVPLAPAAKAELRREGTITRVKIEAERLPPATTLGAASNIYVAWSVSPEGFFENMGELDEKGRLEATTRFEQLGILVTAEPHYLVDRPSSAVVFRSGSPQDAKIRRVTLPVEVGTYDYSTIQFPPKEPVSALPALPSVIVQARYAFQIARSVGADRLAEAELRQAQIAIDTVEEMLRRQSPLEIIWPTANEAIRKSQLAVEASREKVVLLALENSKADAATLRANNQRLETRVQEMTEQQNAAGDQIRRLDADLATARAGFAAARQEIQRFGEERERAAVRERELDAQIAELRERLNSLQQDLTIRLREEFMAPDGTGLTDAGREVLTRVLNFAAIIAGPVRIEGPASDALFEAARQFFIEAGIPQDRIITLR
jgi:hypothetical protein